MDFFPVLGALAPVPLLLAALFAGLRPGLRPAGVPRLAEGAALLALLLAAGSVGQLMLQGAQVTGLLRLDAVSATMALLVAFVGWVVTRYARSYLDGEAREGAFHGLMLVTLAAVLLLVQAGRSAGAGRGFAAVGIGLRHLLLFYGDRAEAQRAAAKFSLVWGAGDVLLAVAVGLLFLAYGTTGIAGIAEAVAAQGLPVEARVAVALMVLVAALKTAAFPLHGWLTEVMEAPTPVSALLHAGIINAAGS
jgi:NAD(P)H-quinone oxidoreductase subunit 5